MSRKSADQFRRQQAILKWFLDRFDRFWAILVSKQRIKHIEQQASDTQARLKTMNKGNSNLAHEQSSDLVRANP